MRPTWQLQPVPWGAELKHTAVVSLQAGRVRPAVVSPQPSLDVGCFWKNGTLALPTRPASRKRPSVARLALREHLFLGGSVQLPSVFNIDYRSTA